jgi:hypothetical protein
MNHDMRIRNLKKSLAAAFRDDCDWAKAGPFMSQLADLAAEVMLMPDSVYAKSIKDLRTLIGQEEPPYAALFWAKPGTSNIARRRLWRTQLLLCISAWGPATQVRVANHLNLPAAESAAAACDFFRRMLFEWNSALWSMRLCEALDVLEDTGREIFHLEHGLMTCGTRRQRLSPQEEKFLELLLAAPGQVVSRKTFMSSGINYPRRVKSLIARKLEGFPVRIVGAQNGSYLLELEP